MAAPKPKPPAKDRWGLPPEDEPVVFDERRFEDLLQQPGVVVRRRDPNAPVEPYVPTRYVIEGSMTVEDLLRLMGRRDDDDFPAAEDERR